MVARLSTNLRFPHPDTATEEGLVAIGGDVSTERLVLAYSQGIFPWPVEGMPLLWFSPDPRFVLRPSELHVSRSLRKVMRRRPFAITMDRAFAAVVAGCATSERPEGQGTWISDELRVGYQKLHEVGLAHSIEAWAGDELVGGLYGVSLGAAFFGESMFARVDDASKIAFVAAVTHFQRWGFDFVDCQVATQHLQRFGATPWRRSSFLAALRLAVSKPTRVGTWQVDVDVMG